ncbi:hypothetical protein Csa_019206 [Cucumis sativus]|uniref:Uncharacterized protein n=1 Tax=Cucumis sativus TaxID=3659 RepID=A0A0A0LIC3_CUCSA|nr:hypothetical protein Csa_019206 [Cucumis sativus]
MALKVLCPYSFRQMFEASIYAKRQKRSAFRHRETEASATSSPTSYFCYVLSRFALVDRLIPNCSN